MRTGCSSSAPGCSACPPSSSVSSSRARRVHPETRTRRRGRRGLPARVLGAIAILLAGAGAAPGASLFDPALRFRAIATPHFLIYFHQDEERLAQRLAPIAEETWRALEQPLGVRPPPLTHVVLA